MKPLNLDNSPCSPISSNCIVWQGPDIPCIHLCTGDTISDVVNRFVKMKVLHQQLIKLQVVQVV